MFASGANYLLFRVVYNDKNVPVLELSVMAVLAVFWPLSGSRGGGSGI